MFCYVEFEAKAPDDTEEELGPLLPLYICLFQNLSIVKGGWAKAGCRFPAHPYFCYCTNTFPEKDPKHTAPQRDGNGESN